jgi:uncharacterized protein (TIGR02118 family)
MAMIKVVWFLEKAEHLSLEEFRRWWLEGHAPVIAAKQGRMLVRYVVNVGTGIDSLPAAAGTPCEWHGFAEEWFESEAAAREALSLPSAPETRADVMAHVRRMSRLVVTEHTILDRTASS